MYEQEALHNKSIVHRFYKEVWNEGNLDLVEELIAPSFVNHGMGSAEGDDREAFKRTIQRVRTGLNFRHTVEELIAEGDTVVARLSGQGEIEKEGPDSGASRERVSGIGVVIWKLHGGRMTERWAFWDHA